MIRTQVQFPDELYRQLQAIAQAKEWSLTETVRRGAEMLVQAHPRLYAGTKAWHPPEPHDFGRAKVDASQWRELLNLERLAE